MASNLQKSGSVSHAPREPSIKEDEDENSSATCNTTSSNSTLPIIGGHPNNGVHTSLHPQADNGQDGSQLSPISSSNTERSVTPLAQQIGEPQIGNRPFLHQSPSMPPQMMKTLSTNEESKMTKSATGQQISSPTTTTIPSQHQTPTNLTTTAFPRGSKNRQTFHGKTEHNRVSFKTNRINWSEFRPEEMKKSPIWILRSTRHLTRPQVVSVALFFQNWLNLQNGT